MKNKKPQNVLFLVLFLVSTFSFSQKIKSEQAPVETKFPEASAFANSKFTIKVIDAPNATYGYDIFADNKLMIHQPSIPGVSGTQGFKSKESAEKVANLVVSKVKNGEMPPTVSIEEMKKLKAIN